MLTNLQKMKEIAVSQVTDVANLINYQKLK